MTGADLRCPECGAGAIDVAPDYDVRPVFGAGGEFPVYAQWWAVMWTCANGHKHITGDRNEGEGVESLRVT